MKSLKAQGRCRVKVVELYVKIKFLKVFRVFTLCVLLFCTLCTIFRIIMITIIIPICAWVTDTKPVTFFEGARIFAGGGKTNLE